MTVTEAAVILGVGANTVRSWLARGMLDSLAPAAVYRLWARLVVE